MKKHLAAILAEVEAKYDKALEEWEFSVERDDPKDEIDDGVIKVNAYVHVIHAIKDLINKHS